MSYDIFVCRFVDGEPAVLDKEVAHEALDPYVTARDENFLQIKAGSDGGSADIHFSSDTNITINHLGGDEIMNVIVELVRRTESSLILPGGTVVLSRDEDRECLPESIRDGWEVAVASTGEEITRAIRES
ncbi:hypothetical protein [Streptomyces formicae]|uniref:Uncharacterized protein n=1 Tax=Streptomyces formicae TaxID=1616117 RepID=A0A291Q896_9ACTN|nr:hypothetical protein [Streptomyces formicae]ATL27644.1 hypothetical protein KY5_2626 [Streptomyces formicae]